MSKTKRSNIKQINLTPISNNMIITAYLVKQTTALILREKPTFLNVQQVLSVGPRVEDVKVGDWVYIDFSRYYKHVKVQSAIKAGVGGQDMIKEEFVPPAFVAPGDNAAYFKISDREIEGVIKDPAKLPKELRDYMTVETFEKAMEKNSKASEDAKRKFDEEMAAEHALKVVEDKVNAPAIVAEGKFRG